ncbi:hypothetical protein [Aeromicrobium sp. CTD01-1L150]|uniref:hypothetical protein n=1 Tax=Aeromicrobium sp. CTD01-1L150 TaxID=3341830 RepID=UPI0035BECBD7
MIEWPGALEPGAYPDHLVARSQRLADAARAADWAAVRLALEESPPIGGVTSWRMSGSSWFTPLHHAARHGAPVTVVEELLARGALTTLEDSSGQTAHDVAKQQGHEHLMALLVPRVEPSDVLRRQSGHLDDLVQELAVPPVRTPLRAPSAAVVLEAAEIRFAVPGYSGGITFRADEVGRLHVSSSSRLLAGGARYHVVTRKDLVLVDFGWDV